MCVALHIICSDNVWSTITMYEVYSHSLWLASWVAAVAEGEHSGFS